MVIILACGRHNCMGSFPSIPEIFSEEKNVDVAEVNQQRCLGENRQWLENVDRTHLVLASGKLVLQKECQAGQKSMTSSCCFNEASHLVFSPVGEVDV